MLRAQTNTLRAQTNTLRAQTNTLRAQTNMLRAQTNMLRAWANMLRAWANTLHAQANMLRAWTNTLRAWTNTLRAQTNMLHAQTNTLEAWPRKGRGMDAPRLERPRATSPIPDSQCPLCGFATLRLCDFALNSALSWPQTSAASARSADRLSALGHRTSGMTAPLARNHTPGEFSAASNNYAENS